MLFSLIQVSTFIAKGDIFGRKRWNFLGKMCKYKWSAPWFVAIAYLLHVPPPINYPPQQTSLLILIQMTYDQIPCLWCCYLADILNVIKNNTRMHHVFSQMSINLTRKKPVKSWYPHDCIFTCLSIRYNPKLVIQRQSNNTFLILAR